jgi:NAD(P)-dependent dehydrogenase (short-subunit alcohol dehydrogenase family)
MDLGIAQKKALVTGSTAGIGLAIALRLAREGAEVVVNGRTQSRVDAAIESIKKELPLSKVTGIAADLGTAAGCRVMTQRVTAVDILVNNLGIFEPKEFEKIPDEDWFRLFEVNVMSGVRLTRHYLGGMKQKNWGRIVFISSESAVQVPAEMVHYGMSKTAQVAIARGIAEGLPGSGVTCNSVLVGPTRSEGVAQFVADIGKAKNTDAATVEKDFFKSIRPSSIIKRFIEVDEVANMVAYLCSTAASATQGSALRVDGGVTLAIL